MGAESEQFPITQEEQCVHRWVIEGHGDSHTQTCKLCGETKTVTHTKVPFRNQLRFESNKTETTDTKRQTRERSAITRDVIYLKMKGLKNSQIAEELGIATSRIDEYPRRFVDTLEISGPDERITLHRAVRHAVATERLKPPPHLTESIPEFEDFERTILDQYGQGVAIDAIARGLKKETQIVSGICKEILDITGAMTSLGLAGWLGREDLQKRHSFQD